jgi:TRIAD3 protein (E3 ubiquitin-protein ligase RNF216)
LLLYSLCCFDDKPLNRMACCSGDNIHFVCRECVKRYVEEEVGKMRCRPKCFADTACEGTFSRKQLMEILEEKTFERFENLQQQEELQLAGLDSLEECPFCDYKAEYPAIEFNKEFQCLAPKCSKTSCRICHRETHIPMSCDEARKDENLSVRHQVEEAKSAALIRNCNKCKNPFVKEQGCNKMRCTKCGHQQCYVCSKDIKDYRHFGDNGCPLHDNHENRHEQEVEKAEKEIIAKIRAERPDISEHELKVEVSDLIKQEEEERKRRAQARVSKLTSLVAVLRINRCV